MYVDVPGPRKRWCTHAEEPSTWRGRSLTLSTPPTSSSPTDLRTTTCVPRTRWSDSAGSPCWSSPRPRPSRTWNQVSITPASAALFMYRSIPSKCPSPCKRPPPFLMILWFTCKCTCMRCTYRCLSMQVPTPDCYPQFPSTPRCLFRTLLYIHIIDHVI